MRPLLMVSLLIGGLVLMWSHVAATHMEGKPVYAPTLSEEMYREIHHGMEINELKGVIGSPPTDELAGPTALGEMCLMVWETKEKCMIRAVCVNGIVQDFCRTELLD